MIEKTWGRTEVAKKLGVNGKSIEYWSATGTIVPYQDSVGKPGIPRKYNAANLLEICILQELSELGISMVLTRKVLADLRKQPPYKGGRDFYLIIFPGTESFCYFGVEDPITSTEELGPLEESALEHIKKGDELWEKAREKSPVPVVAEFLKLLKSIKIKSKYKEMVLFLYYGIFAYHSFRKNKTFISIPVHELWKKISEEFNT